MQGLIVIFITIVTVSVTALGWDQKEVFHLLKGWPYREWRHGEWYRLLSHGLLHADFWHLAFNLYSFYSFAPWLEACYVRRFGSVRGGACFLLLYLGGILAGGLADIGKRDHPYYTSVGASAGVAAILASYILHQPQARIGIMGFLSIPAPLVLLLWPVIDYFLQGDGRVNHMAHLAGLVYGCVFSLALEPALLSRYIKALGQVLRGAP